MSLTNDEHKNIVIAVHIAGKGLQCAAIDLTSKAVLPNSLVTAKVDKDASNRHIIPSWSLNIKKCLSKVDINKVVGIGFSIPGPFDYENGIADFEGVPKFEQLKGLNISKELNRRLMLDYDLEIRYVNDAVGFSIGQNWVSKSNAGRELILIIDSGFGSCFLIDDLPAFEGHGIPLGGSLYAKPFQTGTADDIFSTRGILNSLSSKGCPILLTDEGTIRAAYNNAKGLQVFEEFGSNLGDFMAPFVADFKPNSISLGGLIGSHPDLFTATFGKVLESKGGRRITIKSGGDQSFLLGAARLFENSYWQHLTPLFSKME
ncbi:MAG: ROK family protein [Marinoscillum sp.]